MLPVLTPTDFVDLTNQTLEFAYPSVVIEGEVRGFKISRGRWVYFDIADDVTKIRCFGTVYVLPSPIEDGMKVQLTASPRLHNQFGFSLNISSLSLSGEGTIKKSADLLRAKLEQEGLFAPDRKRTVPYPPKTVGLITSEESAAYADFTKILSARTGGVEIELANIQVQGDSAVAQIVRAIEWFNRQADIVDVLVITRGGGSIDDLQAFSSEQVVRAVASSRIPTVVAIGHEVDISLAEMAADLRASTPSNAAELLVPDRLEQSRVLVSTVERLNLAVGECIEDARLQVSSYEADLGQLVARLVDDSRTLIEAQQKTLKALNPKAVLDRGYAIARLNNKALTSVKDVGEGDIISLELADGKIKTVVIGKEN